MCIKYCLHLVLISSVSFVALAQNKSDYVDYSDYVPPMIGTPGEVSANLKVKASTALRNKFVNYIDQIKKGPASDSESFRWNKDQGEVKMFSIKYHPEYAHTEQPYRTRWESFKPRSYFVYGQSPHQNFDIQEVYLQYYGCVVTSYVKNDIAACAARHAVEELKERACPDRSASWVEKQKQFVAEFMTDFKSVSNHPSVIRALPKDPIQYYNKYAIQDGSTNDAMNYTRRLSEYQEYIANPYACFVAMSSWAEAGTQTKVFRQGYNFTLDEKNMIEHYGSSLNIETAVAPKVARLNK